MVRFERIVPGSTQGVWAILTDTSRLPGWFGSKSTIEPREGGAVNLMNGHVRGVVTRWQPPRRLTYTWNVFSPGETESPYPESYVSFELEAREGDTLIALTHLPVLERFEKQNAMGWHTFLDMVDAIAREETPQSRETYMKQNAARYGIDLSNLAR